MDYRQAIYCNVIVIVLPTTQIMEEYIQSETSDCKSVFHPSIQFRRRFSSPIFVVDQTLTNIRFFFSFADILDSAPWLAHPYGRYVHLHNGPTFSDGLSSWHQRMDVAHQMGAAGRRWHVRMPDIYSANC